MLNNRNVICWSVQLLFFQKTCLYPCWKLASQRKRSDRLFAHFPILPIIHRDASVLTGAVVMHGGSQSDLLLCNRWTHRGAVYVHTHTHIQNPRTAVIANILPSVPEIAHSTFLRHWAPSTNGNGSTASAPLMSSHTLCLRWVMYSSLNVWDVVYVDCVWFPVGGPGHVQQDDMCKKKITF